MNEYDNNTSAEELRAILKPGKLLRGFITTALTVLVDIGIVWFWVWVISPPLQSSAVWLIAVLFSLAVAWINNTVGAYVRQLRREIRNREIADSVTQMAVGMIENHLVTGRSQVEKTVRAAILTGLLPEDINPNGAQLILIDNEYCASTFLTEQSIARETQRYKAVDQLYERRHFEKGGTF